MRYRLEDERLTLEKLCSRQHLLYMGRENRLEDCNSIEEGSANDSEIIQDYKKVNQAKVHNKKTKVRTKTINSGNRETVRVAKMGQKKLTIMARLPARSSI